MYDFGPLAAQNDPKLMEYFQVTKQVGSLINNCPPANFIFVARPGAGKTALVRWLESGDHKQQIVLIQSEETRLIINETFATSEDFRILVVAELYTGLILEIKQRNVLSAPLQKECEEFSNSFWKSIKKGFDEKFEGMSIMGNGFTLKAKDQKAYLDEIRKEHKVQKASEIIQKIGNEIRIIVVIDNPEYIIGQGLEDVSKENAIRIGAFLQALNNLNSLGIRVIAFLKEHVLQSVQEFYRDFSHFEDRTESLEWTENDLQSLLDLRLSKRLGLKWGDVFSLTQDEFGKLVFPILVNGPRDLLNLCNSAGKTDEKITKFALLRSINSMKRQKWVDISAQYDSLWPKIDLFAHSVIAIIEKKFQHKIFTKQQFIAAVEEDFQKPKEPIHDLRKLENWINTALLGKTRIDERLFVIGCLGYVLDGKKYYPWNGRSLEKFRLAEKIFISPSFWNEL